MRDLRMDLFHHLQRLPMSFYEENRVGRIVTRVTNDVAALSELFSAGLITLFKDVVLIGGIATTLLVMNFRLGLVTLLAAPLLAVSAVAFHRFLKAASRRVRAAVSKLNVTMQENIAGAKVIQLFGVEEDRYGRFKRDSDDFMEAHISAVRTHALFAPIISVTSSLAMGLVFWYGGGQAIQGAISLGMLVAFIQYMPHLLTPIRDIGEKFTIL
jgi:ATP-binding cassette subfamily B protein